jgi:hypothetical protein
MSQMGFMGRVCRIDTVPQLRRGTGLTVRDRPGTATHERLFAGTSPSTHQRRIDGFSGYESDPLIPPGVDPSFKSLLRSWLVCAGRHNGPTTTTIAYDRVVHRHPG